jgi:predicted AAA+ superfamily ATPase
MNKESLKTLLLDQRELINEKLKTENIIKREGLANCKRCLAYPNILLISGPRRAGKSFFSHLLVENEKYAYVNFDDERLIGTKASDLNQILECFYELYGDFEFLLFDEIQNIAGWELFVSRLRNKYKIIITGSNASLLSSELASRLTGRFISFNLSPLSFREFLDFNSFKLNKNTPYSTKKKGKVISYFSRYLKEGGIFEYYKFGEEFTRNLFSSIITKDIIGRYEVKYPSTVEELALLTINYFTSKLSLSNLTKGLKVKSSHTVKKYLKYLENTFLVFLSLSFFRNPFSR